MCIHKQKPNTKANRKIKNGVGKRLKYLCPNCNVKVEWKKTGKTVFDMKSQEQKEFVKCTRCGFKAMRTVE